MQRERRLEIVVIAVVLVVGGVAWAAKLRPPLVALPTSLRGIPTELAGLRGVDLPLDGQVEAMLDADQHVQRAYEHPEAPPIWLYVGYYGSARGGTPEHTPRVCYEAHSWNVAASRELRVARGGPPRVQEYLVDDGRQRRLVHFYYRSYRSTGLTTLLALRIDHFVGNLVDGRADGALIRLSSPLGMDDEGAVRSRLLAFAEALEPELAAHWPREVDTREGTGL